MNKSRNWTDTINDCFGEIDPSSNLASNGSKRCYAGRRSASLLTFKIEYSLRSKVGCLQRPKADDLPPAADLWWELYLELSGCGLLS